MQIRTLLAPRSTAVLWYRICVLALVFKSAEAFHWLHMPVSKQGSVTIQLKGTGRQRRSDHVFPHTIVAHFTSEYGRSLLKLFRNYDITDDVPVVLMREGRLKSHRILDPQPVAYFKDRSQEAVFMVWEKNSGSSDGEDTDNLQFFGSFVNGHTRYLVQPPKNKTGSHTLAPLKEAPPINDDLREKAKEVPVDHMKLNKARDHNTTNLTRRGRRQTPEYMVETFFVIDFGLYTFYYEKMTGPDSTRKAQTISAIKQFYAFVLNAMNLRYESVTGSGYTISLRYAGIYIAETAAAAPFVENHRLSSSKWPRIAYDPDIVLSAFTDWANSKLGPQYGYDHAMMFSNYDMGYYNGTFDDSVVGLASMGHVCGTKRYSINEDNFDASVATIAAHELGHNLNAEHDGDRNACPAAANNVMTAISEPQKDPAVVAAQFTFSACSIAYMTQLINKLNSEGNNCLTTQTANYNTSDLDPYLSDLAGQVYPPDTQCQYIRGVFSFLNRGSFNGSYHNICTHMACYVPETGGSSNDLAWEGTTCGSGKMCQRGACVTSSKAPAVAYEWCFFGDAPGVIPGRNETCAQAVGTSATSFQCYSDLYALQCCVTCERHRLSNVNRTDCPYGDMAEWCATLSLGDCYNNAAVCCQSCPDRALNIPSCPYGDRATGCDINKCPYNDVELRTSLCCQTCAGNKTSTTTTTATTTSSTTPTIPSTSPATTTTTTPKTTTTTTSTTTTTKPTTPTTTTTTRPTTTTPTTTTTTAHRPNTTTPTTTHTTTTTTRLTTPTTSTTTTPTITTTTTTTPTTTTPSTTTTTRPTTTTLTTTTATTTTTTTRPITTTPTTTTTTKPTTPTTTTTTRPTTTTLTTTTTTRSTTHTTTTTTTTRPTTTTLTTTTTTRPTTPTTTTTTTTRPTTTTPTTTATTTPTTTTTRPTTTTPTTTTTTRPTTPKTTTTTTTRPTTPTTTPTTTTKPTTTAPTTTTTRPTTTTPTNTATTATPIITSVVTSTSRTVTQTPVSTAISIPATSSPASSTTELLTIIATVVTLKLPINNKDVDLENQTSASYQMLQLELRIQLLVYYRSKMGANVLDIIINRLLRGSIIAEFSVVHENTSASKTELTEANIGVVSGATTLTVLNETVSASSVQVRNTVVTIETVNENVCPLFEASGGCGKGFHCENQAGKPVCVRMTSSSSKEGMGAIVIAAVCGLLLIVVVMTVVAIFCAAKSRRNRKPRSGSIISKSKKLWEDFGLSIVPYSGSRVWRDRPRSYEHYSQRSTSRDHSTLETGYDNHSFTGTTPSRPYFVHVGLVESLEKSFDNRIRE